jgi:hypothetical protein
MAFNVRFFGYRGMRQLVHLAQSQFTSDTVYALEEPYEWSQVVSVNGAVMTPAFSSVALDLSKILRIEIPDGSAVRYEINPPGRNVQAGAQSPKLTGSDVFPWALGYTISVVDAASYP